MAFCRNCGFQVADLSVYCPNCGNKVWRPAQSVSRVVEQPQTPPVQAYAAPEAPVQTYAAPEVPVQTYAAPEAPVQTYAAPEVPLQSFAQTPLYVSAQAPMQPTAPTQASVYTRPRSVSKGGRGLGIISLLLGLVNLLPALIITIMTIYVSIAGIVQYSELANQVGDEVMGFVEEARDELGAHLDASDISGDYVAWLGLVFVAAVGTVVCAVIAKKRGSRRGARIGGLVLGVMELVLCVTAIVALVLLFCIVG
ncbi:MAG: hypothetical protein E7527_02340 [Ruminococcaceae bacterium]|nr:hypothetical protein [Oscillospiraceae bacterium]